MQTFFTPEQLADPALAEANSILRACVHCGMCTATCPTYQVLGDELDSPRGRIYLIKDMLEKGGPPPEQTVHHVDRCLSCLSCMTTCPSGVHYMHLVDLARAHIEKTHKRRWLDRLLRAVLARIIPYPGRFRLALRAARLGRPLRALLPDRRLRAMLEMAPARLPAPDPADRPQDFAPAGARRMRVALMTGCAQRALDTDINAATIRLLTRLGAEVVIAEGAGCCGALTHHMGKEDLAHGSAAANIRAWVREIDGDGLDAIVINASGCGTTVKDYGHMFAGTDLAEDAARVAALARDVTEVLAKLDLPEGGAPELRVTYHAACSLQHGQKITALPKQLLRRVGYRLCEPEEAHLCCGSAGTYNLLQPEISARLKARKLEHLYDTDPEVIATGNIGCMVQLGQGEPVPVVHTVELLDWATGGPRPRKIDGVSP